MKRPQNGLTLEREDAKRARYQSYYSIDINDLSIYHLILNSEHWSVEGLGAIVDTAIEQLNRLTETRDGILL